MLIVYIGEGSFIRNLLSARMKNQGAKVQEKAEAKSTPKKKAVAKAKGSPKKPGPKAKASHQAVKGLLKK